MVEYNIELDSIFHSLADSTRRDMLRLLRIYDKMSVGEIAAHYKMTFAGTSKHLKVLSSARLITKQKKGKKQMISLSPAAFNSVDKYMEEYRRLWEVRFDRLDKVLNEDKHI
jgi:DNA-binding transcriptional ArsR family regulator